MPKIYTIGYSGKTQDSFLEVLNAVDVSTIVDVRLWRQSRFVPWASGTNLSNILDSRYRYIPELAPTKELLTRYKNAVIDWSEYEKVFNNLLAERQIEQLFEPGDLDVVCFLCSEKTADQCHRRLVAEYLQRHFPEVKIVHL